MKWLKLLLNRPKKIDEDHVLEQTLMLFWRNGYLQTSLVEIAKATKIEEQALSNHFGGKREIFIASLERYVNSRLVILLNAASAEADPVKSIDIILDHFEENAKRAICPGCYLANATVELGGDEKVKDLTNQGFEKIADIVTTKLTELEDRFTPESAAITSATMINSLIGLGVTARSLPSADSIDQIFSGLRKMVTD